MLGSVKTVTSLVTLSSQSQNLLGSQIRHFSKKPNKSVEALNRPKIKQTAYNYVADLIPGFEKIKPEPCSSTVILENFKEFLLENNPVQISQGCLFRVIQCVDQWNKRNSLLDKPNIKKILSGDLSVHQAQFDDFEEMAFIKAHLLNPAQLSEEQQKMTPTDKRFITKFIGHSILTDIYISAKEMENHFINTNQPVYSMIKWEKNNYQAHAIPIFGIDTHNNIHFWDVSDRLGECQDRVQTMNIEEFNDRRNLPPEYVGTVKSLVGRSQIYFFNKESK